ncbi:hypothetical protein KDA14_04520, partial [Candidatus Saccharibacteria bacterium]|nr:hypothetical protein [Candidatus Saccharibacteria bacterium]
MTRKRAKKIRAIFSPWVQQNAIGCLAGVFWREMMKYHVAKLSNCYKYQDPFLMIEHPPILVHHTHISGAFTMSSTPPSVFLSVPEGTFAIVERFGRYNYTANPGINILYPFMDSVKVFQWSKDGGQNSPRYIIPLSAQEMDPPVLSFRTKDGTTV